MVTQISHRKIVAEMLEFIKIFWNSILCCAIENGFSDMRV